MTTQTEALKLALEALEGLIKKTSGQSIYSFMETERRIAMSACVGIKEALAQQEGQSNYCLQCEALSRELAALKAQQSNEQVEQRLELIGHADLAINNIYIFSGYGEEVPEGRTPIYAGYKNTHPPVLTAQPEQEYKRGYADAMNWKAQNHLEHLQPKVRTGDCLLTGVCASEGHKIQPKEPEQEHVADREVLRLADAIELRVENKAERMVIADKLRKLAYTTPPQRKPLTDEHCTWKQQDDIHMPDTWEADCGAMWTFTEGGPKDNDMHYCPKCGKPAIEAAHGIKE